MNETVFKVCCRFFEVGLRSTQWRTLHLGIRFHLFSATNVFWCDCPTGIYHFVSSGRCHMSINCKKCRGRLERIATIPQSMGQTGYAVYQCVDCKRVEWVTQNG
jgi:hypothetical protein